MAKSITLNNGTACSGCSPMHTRSTPIPKEQKGKLEGEYDLSGVRVQDTDDLSALPKAGKKEIGAFRLSNLHQVPLHLPLIIT